MAMSKRDFIALADAIREHNRVEYNLHANGHTCEPFTKFHIETLANFCAKQNANFKRDRWLGYIAGTNGKNGGAR